MLALAKIPSEEDAASQYLYLFVSFPYEMMRVSTPRPRTGVGRSDSS